MKNLICLIGLLTSLTSFAGTETGNGGDGVKYGDKVYLADLVEFGNHLSVYFKSDQLIDNDYLEAIKKKFKNKISEEEQRLIALKLSEIKEKSYILSNVILDTIKAYQWRWMDLSLVQIYDADYTVEIPVDKIVQLAVRKQRTIRIHTENWKKMDIGNKVALIFHEALYASITPEPNALGGFYQSSQKTRDMTGLLFSDDFKNEDYASLKTFANNTSGKIFFDNCERFEFDWLVAEYGDIAGPIYKISHSFESYIDQDNNRNSYLRFSHPKVERYLLDRVKWGTCSKEDIQLH